LVAPKAYAREAEKLAQNLFLAPSTIAQYAALEAFSEQTLEICEARRVEFIRRRDFLVPALRALGFSIPVVPQGAFYVYADSGELAEDSRTLARRALDEVGVAITPGLDFGQWRPERHIRFAYTTSLDALKEGVECLARIV
jgi:aspartate/methionine/tyrosine aminotransferase